MQSLRHHPGVVACSSVVAVFAVLVAAWPGWTLAYARVLAWPLVALAAVLAFGPGLARRFPSITSLEVPGGFKATFNQQIDAIDASAELADLWGPVVDEAELVDADEPEPHAVVDPLETAQAGVKTLFTIVGAFQVQLDLLRTVRAAHEGLTHAAMVEFLRDGIRLKGGDPTAWNIDELIEWLVRQDALTVQPNGAYVITEHGDRVLSALDLPGMFVAPKTY